MYRDLTKGSITKALLLFALPMAAGDLLQQFYNIADTLIVGQALGKNALAAVGSAFVSVAPDSCGAGAAPHAARAKSSAAQSARERSRCFIKDLL